MDLCVRELTTRGAGAVSVLEVTGEGAFDAVEGLISSGDYTGGSCQGEELRVSQLCDGEEVMDEAIVVTLSSSKVELHLHGSPVLVARVIGLLGGELESTKETSSIRAEAEALLNEARGELTARILLDQVEGALTRHLEEVFKLEESDRSAALSELLLESQRLAPFLEAPRVVLAGPTNAGKSTLFNVLMGSERAITSSEEGTTRDLLLGVVHLDGFTIELVDTAGERAVLDPSGSGGVELAGQGAARALRERADLVLWLERAGSGSGQAPVGAIVLKTHADLCVAPPQGAISAVLDPMGARKTVSDLLKQRFGIEDAQWVPGQPILFSSRLRALVESILRGSIEGQDLSAQLSLLLAEN